MSQKPLPAPLVPAECNLQTMPSLLVDVVRLRDSDFAATVDPGAGFYAVLLWAAAWHQERAGSLPASDVNLAKLAGLGRDLDTWNRYKEGALYGFLLCSDNRYYHPFLCTKALERWIERLSLQLRSGKGNKKRHGTPFDEVKLGQQLERAVAALHRIETEFLHKADEDRPGNQLEIPTGNADEVEQRSQVKLSEVKVSKEEPPKPPADGGGLGEDEGKPKAEAETEKHSEKPPARKKGKKAAPDPFTGDGYSPGFDRFWDVYPKKRAKPVAFKLWLRDALEAYTDVIVKDVETRKVYDNRWVKEGGEYIPDPTTYINQQRWNDDMEPVRTNGSARANLEDANSRAAEDFADE